MILLNGERFACGTCIRGHRTGLCVHLKKELYSINQRGGRRGDDRTRLRAADERCFRKFDARSSTFFLDPDTPCCYVKCTLIGGAQKTSFKVICPIVKTPDMIPSDSWRLMQLTRANVIVDDPIYDERFQFKEFQNLLIDGRRTIFQLRELHRHPNVQVESESEESEDFEDLEAGSETSSFNGDADDEDSEVNSQDSSSNGDETREDLRASGQDSPLSRDQNINPDLVNLKTSEPVEQSHIDNPFFKPDSSRFLLVPLDRYCDRVPPLTFPEAIPQLVAYRESYVRNDPLPPWKETQPADRRANVRKN